MAMRVKQRSTQLYTKYKYPVPVLQYMKTQKKMSASTKNELSDKIYSLELEMLDKLDQIIMSGWKKQSLKKEIEEMNEHRWSMMHVLYHDDIEEAVN